MKDNDGKRCPIDFDHESPEHARNWVGQFRDIRESSCPLAWSANHGGFWVATRYQDIIDIAQDYSTFTNGKKFDPQTGTVEGGLAIPPIAVPRVIPNETDPPEWEGFRKLLNRHFAPKTAKERGTGARKYAVALMDRVIEQGHCDIVEDFASPVPALVVMELFGLPLDEWRRFADPVHAMFALPRNSPLYQSQVLDGVDWIQQRVAEEISDRRRAPKADLLSCLVAAEMDGSRMSDETIGQIAFNLILGGVDTTTALTSNVLMYLAQNPDEKERLIKNPAMIPVATEEFVRYFSPVHGNARNVSRDAVMNGQCLRQGERVLLAYAAGNRDPEIFGDPDKIILNRFPNRHIGFGAGPHRCLGSFMARAIFEVMLTEVLNRIPDYSVILDNSIPYDVVSSVNGWSSIHITFTPGEKIGSDISL